MSTFQRLLAALGVAFFLLGSASPAVAQSAEQDSVADSVAPVDSRVTALLEPQDGDSKKCSFVRDFVGNHVDRRATNAARYVDNLTEQLIKRPDDKIVLQAAIVDPISIAEAIPSSGSNVRVTGVGMVIAGTTFSIANAQVDSADEHFALARSRGERYIAFEKEVIAFHEMKLAEAIEKGKTKQIKRERAELRRAETRLRRAQRAFARLTIDSVVVNGFQLEGTPQALLDYLGSERVYSARLLINPVLLPSVIERVMDDRDLDRADAMRWIRKHNRAANGLRGKIVTPLSQRTITMAERDCSK